MTFQLTIDQDIDENPRFLPFQDETTEGLDILAGAYSHLDKREKEQRRDLALKIDQKFRHWTRRCKDKIIERTLYGTPSDLINLYFSEEISDYGVTKNAIERLRGHISEQFGPIPTSYVGERAISLALQREKMSHFAA